MCTLLSHLLSLPQMVPSDQSLLDPMMSPALISECTRYAILLHVFSPWKWLPPDGTLTINYLLHRLIDCLQTILRLSGLQFNNDLMLWILATGGVAALNLPERIWFVSHIRDMTEAVEIETWDQMKSRLRRIIWHEILCSRSHERLWLEVSQMKKSVDPESDVIRSGRSPF